MAGPQKYRDERDGGRYATMADFIGYSSGNIVDSDDQLRWQAYQFYDDVYHNRPETFKATIRGEDDEQRPIYLPSGGSIIDAVSRFLGVDFSFTIELAPTPGSTDSADQLTATDEEIQALQTYFSTLFDREQFAKKYDNNKRYGLVRGDAMFHIVADDTKDPGGRISIYELHPGQYFPIKGGSLGDEYVGCHIISTITHPNDPKKEACLRQTYRYEMVNGANGTLVKSGVVTSELSIWELGKWDDRAIDAKTEKVSDVWPATPLPSEINVIPVYHMRNNEIPGDEYGRSELAGFETILNAINQSITDEDMTLVMQGLGMFWTNAPPPTDAEGVETSWEVGPGQVIEVGDGQTFGRLNGVSSVAPFLEHIDAIEKRMQKKLGLSDVAIGDIDVATVESGIALQMKLAPILARNVLKEVELRSVINQMFYDLATKWFPAYEQVSFGSAVPKVSFGDPLPVDRKSIIDEVIQLMSTTPPIITLEMAQQRLAELGGYEFTSDSAELSYLMMGRITDALAGTGVQAEEEFNSGSEVEEEAPEESA